LTALRRRTLELLWEHDQPIGAYELIELLRRSDSRAVAPPTVYRALDFLIGQGLVARIASRNAYVPRVHPERRQTSMFLVCSLCGRSAELEDHRIERLLGEDATAIGFRISRPVIELEGVCLQCSETGGVT
jgi:Fe2+/Zn2+ uptake regulation proteins